MYSSVNKVDYCASPSMAISSTLCCIHPPLKRCHVVFSFSPNSSLRVRQLNVIVPLPLLAKHRSFNNLSLFLPFRSWPWLPRDQLHFSPTEASQAEYSKHLVESHSTQEETRGTRLEQEHYFHDSTFFRIVHII